MHEYGARCGRVGELEVVLGDGFQPGGAFPGQDPLEERWP